MRNTFRILAILVPAMLVGQVARAQTSISVTAIPPATANITVNLVMNLQGAIVLKLEGNTLPPITALSNITATSADVNFGNVNTACSIAPTTGQCVRITTGLQGAHFVATIDATVTVSGSAAATSKLGVSAPAAAGTNARRYNVCGSNGSCNADPSSIWNNQAFGIDIPLAPTAALNELGAAIASGATVEHQLVVQVLDTIAAGGVSPVVVSYVATSN